MEKINLKIILIVIFILALLAIGIFLSAGKTEEKEQESKLDKALKFIVEDAKAKFNDADEVSIINIMPLKENSCENCLEANEGEYLITLKLVYYGKEGGIFCPKRYHVRYIYPNRGFANMPPELIVGNCNLCKNGECSISMKEEAIIASYNVDDEVKSFIKENDATPIVIGNDGDKEWTILWKGNGKTLKVVINSNGEIIERGVEDQ